MDTQKKQAKLVVAMVGAELLDIPDEGLTLEQLENYDPSLTYMRAGKVIGAETVIRPGDTIFSSQPHDNG